MPYTTTTDRTAGYTVTAADWNILEDNSTFLFGDTGWTNVTVFTGTWGVGGIGTPRFVLIGRVVYMTGTLSGGTINTAAFTLPAGYRPSGTVLVATTASAAYATMQIASTGVVTPQTGSATNFSIACCFPVI